MCYGAGDILPDVMCLEVPLASVQACNNFTCEYEYVLGDWSPCDRTCGGGHSYRTYVCEDQFGRVAPSSSLCTVPASAVTLVRQCNTAPCLPARYLVTDNITATCSQPCMSQYPSSNVPTLPQIVQCIVNDTFRPLSTCTWRGDLSYAASGMQCLPCRCMWGMGTRCEQRSRGDPRSSHGSRHIHYRSLRYSMV